MKTHELARALNHLSRVLRAGPNVDFEELTNLSTYLSSARLQPQTRDTEARSQVQSREAEKRDMADKGTGLALLAQMASYNKQELLDLAEYFGINIEVRKSDAVRDVLGKILRSIQENPITRDRLVRSGTEVEPDKTSALARALAILMKQP